MTPYPLERLAPDAIAARLDARPLLVLPIGTIEWHSHHLPVGLDGLVAEGVAAQIAETCDALLLPTMWWAVGGVPFPYTLNLSAPLIEPLLVSVFEQFGAMGVRVLVAFTGHFGRDHTAALKRAACTVMARSPLTILPLTPYDLVTDRYDGDHAGPGETSMLWALAPDLVHLDAVPAEAPLPGVIGPDPHGRASAEWGAQTNALIAERAAWLAQRLLGAGENERAAYLAAMLESVRVLEAINDLRATRPAAEVPPLVTPAYRAFCQALARGDFDEAQAHARMKRDDLFA